MTNRAAPSTPKSRMPQRKGDVDLDAVVEQLFRSIQLGFDRRLVQRLGRGRGVDIARAETELRLLDLFAVYLAIKTTDGERWRHMGAAVFERVGTRVLTSWASAWDTKDDIVEVLNGRFAAYNRLAAAAGPADLNGMTELVGLLCAVIIQGDRRVFAGDAKTAGEALVNVVVDLLEDDNLLRTTAATVFKTRFDAVSELYLTLSTLICGS